MRIDATISNLTVAQAHASFFKAVRTGNLSRADKIKAALRAASKRLREALVLAHRTHRDEAERKLREDLERIHEALEWKDTGMAKALRRAGVR